LDRAGKGRYNSEKVHTMGHAIKSHKKVLNNNILLNLVNICSLVILLLLFPGPGFSEPLQPGSEDLGSIGLTHKKAERPRILFMVAEQNIGDTRFIYWWWSEKREFIGEITDMTVTESVLKETFLKHGFNVIDISGSLPGLKISNAYRIADLTKNGAREISKQLNADIVVIGKAFAKEGPSTTGSKVASYIANVTAQAVRVDDGKVLASAMSHSVARHISGVIGGAEALERASSELGNKLIEQIVANWTNPTALVSIRIKGISNYDELTELKNTLKGLVRGVNAVYQRKFKGDEAVLEVETSVTAQILADDLARIAKPPLRVIGTTANTIEVLIGQVGQ
jgi:hypothetical protein